MKASNLISGMEATNVTEVILKNALTKIDELEKEIEFLTGAAIGSTELIRKICHKAEINYSHVLKTNCLYISQSFASDTNEYDCLKELLELEEPEEEKEEE